MDLYVATSNAGKLADFEAAAQRFGGEFRIQPLPGLADIAAPEETGDTFEANARLKAEFYSRHAPGMWVLADDSGLEVDALQGRPGVRSARFAQDLGSLDSERSADASNNEALLLAMLEETNRAARYRCVLALAVDGRFIRYSYGISEGFILTEPDGEFGFGYDPLFWIPSVETSMGRLDPQQRLSVSHRGHALEEMLVELMYPGKSIANASFTGHIS